MIYLDHNATTPLLPEVREAVIGCLDNTWGNPSSAHKLGAMAKRAVETAREEVANFLTCSPPEVIFTSGATEANNAALLSGAHGTKKHLVALATEHSSVLGFIEHWRESGQPATLQTVSCAGVVDLDSLRAALRPDTALVSVMAANNETGVLQPVDAIAALCREVDVRFHCDAVQAVGKIPWEFSQLQCDYATISGHKLGAPKGVGALIVRSGVPYRPQLIGGKQEEGRRGGTEGVAQIVGFGVACRLAKKRLQAWQQVERLRDSLERALRAHIPDVYFNGDSALRLPNTSNFGVPGVDSDSVVAFMDRHDIAVSSGSACLANALSPSHVVMAMRNNYQQATEAIRVSLSPENTSAEIDQFVALLSELVARLR